MEGSVNTGDEQRSDPSGGEKAAHIQLPDDTYASHTVRDNTVILSCQATVPDGQQTDYLSFGTGSVLPTDYATGAPDHSKLFVYGEDVILTGKTRNKETDQDETKAITLKARNILVSAHSLNTNNSKDAGISVNGDDGEGQDITVTDADELNKINGQPAGEIQVFLEDTKNIQGFTLASEVIQYDPTVLNLSLSAHGGDGADGKDGMAGTNNGNGQDGGNAGNGGTVQLWMQNPLAYLVGLLRQLAELTNDPSKKTEFQHTLADLLARASEYKHYFSQDVLTPDGTKTAQDILELIKSGANQEEVSENLELLFNSLKPKADGWTDQLEADVEPGHYGKYGAGVGTGKDGVSNKVPANTGSFRPIYTFTHVNTLTLSQTSRLIEQSFIFVHPMQCLMTLQYAKTLYFAIGHSPTPTLLTDLSCLLQRLQDRTQIFALSDNQKRQEKKSELEQFYDDNEASVGAFKSFHTLCDIHRQVLTLGNQIQGNFDYFGNSYTYVQSKTTFSKYTSNTAESSIHAALDAYGTMEQSFNAYSTLRERARDNVKEHLGKLEDNERYIKEIDEQLSVYTAAAEEARKNVNKVQVQLCPNPNDPNDGSMLNKLKKDFEALEEKIKKLVNVNADDVLDALTTCAFAPKDVTLWAANALKLAHTAKTTIRDDEGDNVQKNYVIDELKEVEATTCSQLVESYKSSPDGTLTLTDPGAVKLSGQQKDLKKILDQFKKALHDVKAAENLENDFDRYVELITARNEAVLKYNTAITLEHQSQKRKESAEKSIFNDTSDIVSEYNPIYFSPTYDEMMISLYMQQREIALRAVYEACCLYRYEVLPDHGSDPGVPSDDDPIALLRGGAGDGSYTLMKLSHDNLKIVYDILIGKYNDTSEGNKPRTPGILVYSLSNNDIIAINMTDMTTIDTTDKNAKKGCTVKFDVPLEMSNDLESQFPEGAFAYNVRVQAVSLYLNMSDKSDVDKVPNEHECSIYRGADDIVRDTGHNYRYFTRDVNRRDKDSNSAFSFVYQKSAKPRDDNEEYFKDKEEKYPFWQKKDTRVYYHCETSGAEASDDNPFTQWGGPFSSVDGEDPISNKSWSLFIPGVTSDTADQKTKGLRLDKITDVNLVLSVKYARKG